MTAPTCGECELPISQPGPFGVICCCTDTPTPPPPGPPPICQECGRKYSDGGYCETPLCGTSPLGSCQVQNCPEPRGDGFYCDAHSNPPGPPRAEAVIAKMLEVDSLDEYARGWHKEIDLIDRALLTEAEWYGTVRHDWATMTHNEFRTKYGVWDIDDVLDARIASLKEKL